MSSLKMDSERAEKEKAQQEAIARRMNMISHKVLVLSGKGGVGKSTVAVNLAAALVLEGKRVGLMDIDMHGPSVAGLLNVDGVLHGTPEGGIQPVQPFEGLEVMSVGYMLERGDDPVIWRGPMKHGVIKQFLAEVEWGELDYLIVDSPPGTGDEPLSIAQLMKKSDGAVIVTTPQSVAVDDVRRSIGFCRRVDVPVLGVVENMSGFVCPHCGEESEIFKRGGGASLADQMKVRFLGGIPIDPDVVQACDEGVPFIRKFSESRTARAFLEVVRTLMNLMERNEA